MTYVVRTGCETSFGLVLLRSGKDFENEIIFRPQRDPDKPPQRERGDVVVVSGMMIGAIVGGAAGTVLAVCAGVGSVFVDLSLGAVALGILGTLIGERIKRARWKS